MGTHGVQRYRVGRLTEEEFSRFRAGEEGPFRHLVAAHTRRLRAYASRYTWDPDEVDDLVQETWTEVYERRRRFENRGSVGGWIFRVCRSVCVMHVRRCSQTRAALRAMIALPSSASEPPNSFATQVIVDAATDLVMALPRRQRLVVIYRIMAGYGTRETARVLGCAEGTIKATLCQAMRILRPHAANLRSSSADDELLTPERSPGTLSLSDQAQIRVARQWLAEHPASSERLDCTPAERG